MDLDANDDTNAIKKRVEPRPVTDIAMNVPPRNTLESREDPLGPGYPD